MNSATKSVMPGSSREDRIRTIRWLRATVGKLRSLDRQALESHIDRLERACLDLEEEISYHPVYCAWCEADGRENIINWAGVKNSHGVCPEHRQALRAEAEIRLAKRRLEDLYVV